MAETAGFLQIPGWTAQTGRLAHISALINQSANSALTALQVRGGVLPGYDIVTHSFAPVTRTAGANMSLDIYPGVGIVQGTEATNQGAYAVWETAKVNRIVPTADPSHPRHDLVVLRVKDSFYSGAVNTFTIEVIAGSPAVTPVDPAIPANSVAIARIVVATSTTSITLGTNLFDIRPFTAARGGTLIVPNVNATGGTETNLKPTSPEPYQHILDADSSGTADEHMRVWINALSRWDVVGVGIGSAYSGSYTPTLTCSSVNPVLGTGATAVGRYVYITHDLVYFTAVITIGTTPTAGTGTYRISLPFTASGTTVVPQIGVSGLVLFSPSTWTCVGTIAPGGAFTTLTISNATTTTPNVVASTLAGGAYAAGVQYIANGYYRIAAV